MGFNSGFKGLISGDRDGEWLGRIEQFYETMQQQGTKIRGSQTHTYIYITNSTCFSLLSRMQKNNSNTAERISNLHSFNYNRNN